MDKKGTGISRRTLFAGLASATAGSALLGRFSGTPTIIQGGFGDQWDCALPPTHSQGKWVWWVDTPRGERTVLQSGPTSGESTLQLMLEYPYPGETVYGIYRYGLTATMEGEDTIAATTFEVRFRPYRFGS